MSDETTPTTASPAPVDPVAEARRIMASQSGAPADELAGLKKQVKTLWVLVIVTLVLTVLIGAYSVVPRLLGVGRGFGTGNFQPGQFRQQGTGQGVPGQGPAQPTQ